jgi:putative ABC transport system permease protein
LARTLGVAPLLGDWPKDPMGVAISHRLWQRMFGGQPNVLGSTLDLGIAVFVIEAVMPAGFHLLNTDTDIWLYQPDENLSNTLRSPNRLFSLIGRLKPGVTIDEAQAEMAALAQRVGEQFPETHSGWSFKVESLQDAYVGGVRESLWVFKGAVFFVLLIACSNVAALVMSRAAARQKEWAIRSALGSGRWRIIRQLLTDNLVLSFLGAALGVSLAWIGVRVLVASGIEGFPRLSEVGVDWHVLTFACLTALTTGIIFGVIPALRMSSPDLMRVLREESRGSSGGLRQQRFRAAFVVGQVSLSLIILVVSGLMLRSFALINAAGVGFETEDLLVLELPFPRTYYRNTRENTAAGGLLVEFDSRFLDDSQAVIANLSAVAGVRAVAATTTPPLGGAPPRVGIRREGETLDSSQLTARSAEWYAISEGYFATLGITVLRGRVFDDGDRLDSRPVAVINAAMAERYWPGEDPLGRRFQTDSIDDPMREVIGVVGDVRQDRYQRAPQPQLYVPRRQLPRRMDTVQALEVLLTSIVVKVDGGVAGKESSLRAAVQEAVPAQPVSRFRAVEEYASAQVQDLRRLTWLLTAFGVVAVALALVGIFGVVSHLVSQRRTELGIRIALGAQRH